MSTKERKLSPILLSAGGSGERFNFYSFFLHSMQTSSQAITCLSRWPCLLHDCFASVRKAQNPVGSPCGRLPTEIHTVSFLFLAFVRNWYNLPAHCCHHRRKLFKCLQCSHMLKIQIFHFIIMRTNQGLPFRKQVSFEISLLILCFIAFFIWLLEATSRNFDALRDRENGYEKSWF